MKINYNELARYLLDKKIEIPLFSEFKKITELDWIYYRELITDNWLNKKGEIEGISVPSIIGKINHNSRKLNNKNISAQDLNRAKLRFASGNNLKNNTYSFKDLKGFLNFKEPLEILFSIYKKDLKKRITIISSTKLNDSISYLNTKRAEQYHPESSDIYHQIPFNENDIRQMLVSGRELFYNLGNSAISSSFEFYLNDIHELIKEWQSSIEINTIKKVFSNLPKREHTEWGFVGYKLEKQELISKISKGNRRLFQVVGQGGSGKSALVNEVCHDVMLRYELGFKQFIWISSKSDIIYNASIKTLNKLSKYNSYKDLLSQMFLAINNEDISDFKNYSNISIDELEKEVIQSINGNDGIKRLIVVDNLENISKENQKNIITFLEENVDRPNYVIITSRHRIIEDFPSVKIELGGLGEEHGTDLFLKFIDYYQINFKISSKEDRENIKRFVKIANYYPLAIKYCIEKALKDNISINTSFESFKKGNSLLHSFIFRDTYQALNPSERRLLKTIVVYKTHWQHDIDKHILRVIFNSIYKADNFDKCIDVLFEKTLISYIGLSDDDVDVVLTELVTSHVEDIFMRYDMDNSKIINAINSFMTKQKELSDLNIDSSNIRTSEIQKSIFLKALPNLSNQIAIDSAITEILKFSSTFYGLGYLEAKSKEFSINNSNRNIVRKVINDLYLKSISLRPQISLFWGDYLIFLKQNYPSTIVSKLNQNLGQLISVFFNITNPGNQERFAQIILDYLSITKNKIEERIQFMDYVIQNKITLKFQVKHLPMINDIITVWLRKQNKVKYIDVLMNNDLLKTMIIKHNYPLFKKISDIKN